MKGEKGHIPLSRGAIEKEYDPFAIAAAPPPVAPVARRLR
jgi:hypothetical protein